MKTNSDNAKLIIKASADINAAIARMKATSELRDTSDDAYAEWKNACRARPESAEQFYDRIMRFLNSDMPCSDDRAFALQHVDLNPRFFRSGYLMDRVLKRFKQLDLTTLEINVLQRAVLRAIDTNVGRGFRRYCRLIPRLADEHFVQSILDRTKAQDTNIRSRARFAIGYVRHI